MKDNKKKIKRGSSLVKTVLTTVGIIALMGLLATLYGFFKEGRLGGFLLTIAIICFFFLFIKFLVGRVASVSDKFGFKINDKWWNRIGIFVVIGVIIFLGFALTNNGGDGSGLGIVVAFFIYGPIILLAILFTSLRKLFKKKEQNNTVEESKN